MAVRKPGTGSGSTAMQTDIANLKAVTGSASSTIVPVEGGTYTLAQTDRTINIVNAEAPTDLAAITVNLPTARVGQRLFFHSLKQIDSVTFAMPGGTVDNWQVSLSAGDSVDFTMTKLTNWARSV